MKDAIEKVEEFCRVFGYPVRKIPTIPPTPEIELGRELLEEELREFFTAAYECNLLEVADGLGDLLYSVIWLGLIFGLPTEEIFNEVHRSNMTKLGKDGKPLRGPTGRVLKGPNFEVPCLAEILLKRLKKKEEI